MSPEQLALASEKRIELVEKVADVDEQLGELFLMEEPIDEPTLREAIRYPVAHAAKILHRTSKQSGEARHDRRANGRAHSLRIHQVA